VRKSGLFHNMLGLVKYICSFIKQNYFLTLDSGFGSQECTEFLNEKKIEFIQAMRPSKDYGVYCKKLDQLPLEKGEWASCVLSDKIFYV